MIPYANNPRNNDDAVDAVASSIKEFGFKVPIVIDRNCEIVTGHTRLKAAKKLGLEEVPCIVADDLTEAQIKAFRLADNKVSEIATWDTELLSAELEELEVMDIDFNISDFGFEDKQAEELKEIKTVELIPYKKVHYLISADLNLNDKIIQLIEQIKNMEGVEIESTLN